MTLAKNIGNVTATTNLRYRHSAGQLEPAYHRKVSKVEKESRRNSVRNSSPVCEFHKLVQHDNFENGNDIIHLQTASIIV